MAQTVNGYILVFYVLIILNLFQFVNFFILFCAIQLEISNSNYLLFESQSSSQKDSILLEKSVGLSHKYGNIRLRIICNFAGLIFLVFRESTPN